MTIVLLIKPSLANSFQRCYRAPICPGIRTVPLFKSASASSAEESHRTLVEGVHTAEQTIKRSRFIGIASRCDNWVDAQKFFVSVRAEHPKARHVCIGFVAGHNPVQERASDDGEPTGTAGPPILGGINGEGLSDVACAVVRYSGGIKLGAGGLIRAYGGTARLVLREAPSIVLIPKSTVQVTTSAANAGIIYHTANKYGGSTSGDTYDYKGNLEMTIVCETANLEDLKESIKDATRGDVDFLE